MEDIYRILNEFNALLGERPISVRPDMCRDEKLYFRMLYSKTVDPAKMTEDWCAKHNSGMVYGMAAVLLREGAAGAVDTLLPTSGIYANDFTMPDKELARRYLDACRRFIPDWSPIFIDSRIYRPVHVSTRALLSGLRTAEQDMAYYLGETGRNAGLFANHRKLRPSDIYDGTLLDGLEAHAGRITSSARTIRLVLKALSTRDDVPEWARPKLERRKGWT